MPELLAGLAPLDLPAQGGGDLEPGRFQRVVAGLGMDVRARHGQRYKRAEGRCVVPPLFQHYRGGGNRNEALQPFDGLLQPMAQTGVEIETENVELDFHGFRWVEFKVGKREREKRGVPGSPTTRTRCAAPAGGHPSPFWAKSNRRRIG